ncbi:sensor histidine kinase [Variovorax sp. PCZ-1]|uniref:sensor histidine kinase n=1 Tax=Variovorax sp. PCZ-1 TaxID=2835533 RepID=UPI001BCEEFBC|nr:sensor histidine kinase [Variovorax sp. PCZ-1]MBS7808798.1 sensor histidine kinase N-terminal domain-containing protein [Variovorax sp. PCZ-1]
MPSSNTPQLSLKRQLLLWLLLPQLLLWLVGGTLAFRIALSYAEKGIDQSLTQSVRSLARQVKPVGSGLLIDFPKAAQAIIEEDPEDKVSYMVSSPPGQFILGNAKLPEPPASVLQGLLQKNDPLLYQAMIGSEESKEGSAARELRIAVLELQFGEVSAPQRIRVQVAKSLAVRERIARELVFDMLVPLLLLGAVLGALVYAGIARGLQPLARLQDQLQAQSGRDSANATALAPIALQQAPQEVHQLAGAVNQLLGAVQRSLSQEKRFVNDAAHQLRTPLAGLQTQLDLALSEPDPQALQERLQKVSAGVQRSGHLVHQLLQLARSEADVPMQALDAAQLARSIAQDAAPAAIAAGVDFGFEHEEGDAPLMIQGNALLLREAITNLIDNAVRYAGRGATITLRARRAGAQVCLEVEDNGSGLPPEELSKVFERFYRLSETPGGAGLGLAIVQEIAHRHGGQARAVAVVPHGLRVEILL